MQTPAVIGALGALAHEHRLAIYRILVEQGPAGLPAGLNGPQSEVIVVNCKVAFHLMSTKFMALRETNER